MTMRRSFIMTSVSREELEHDGGRFDFDRRLRTLQSCRPIPLAAGPDVAAALLARGFNSVQQDFAARTTRAIAHPRDVRRNLLECGRRRAALIETCPARGGSLHRVSPT